jgi:phosphoserine phosphatase
MDAGLWKGKDLSAVQRYLSELRTTEGAPQLVHQAHSLGVTTMIISTGILAVAERVAGMLGIGIVESNEVEMANGSITGRVTVRCGFEEKGFVLRRTARNMGIPMAHCACVGNDQNDLPMFEAVPFSVAFNPTSERVARKATVVVRGQDLLEVARVLSTHFKSLRSCTPR